MVTDSVQACLHIHGYLEILPQKLNLDPVNEYFVPVDHLAISVTRMHSWAEYCDSNHRGHCHSLAPSDLVGVASNLIFIDVELSCLVHASGSAQYLALSYVWGQISPTLELKVETANKLFQVGSLTLPEFLELLPNTIRDAMLVTKSLGVRYLWVDRLCIVRYRRPYERPNVLNVNTRSKMITKIRWSSWVIWHPFMPMHTSLSLHWMGTMQIMDLRA